jgi:hypothetical protein
MSTSMIGTRVQTLPGCCVMSIGPFGIVVGESRSSVTGATIVPVEFTASITVRVSSSLKEVDLEIQRVAGLHLPLLEERHLPGGGRV